MDSLPLVPPGKPNYLNTFYKITGKIHVIHWRGLPGGSAVKNLPAVQKTQDAQVQSLVWGDPQPTPAFLPEDSHGKRSLAGCSSWGCKESDITQATEQAGRQRK